MIMLLIVTGILTTVLALSTNGLWLRFVIKVPDSFFDMAYLYMTIYSVGLLFQFGYNIAASILRAVGDSRSSLYFLAAAAAINIVLDLVFVAGFHLGVMGVALATSISQCVSMVFGFTYMYKKHPIFRPNKKHLRFERSVIKDILVTGFPMVIQQIIVSCGFMLLQRLVNSFEDEALTAAHTVACRLECYMLVPLLAFGSSMATFAGQNFGAGKILRLKSGTKQTVIMGILTAAAVGAICFICAPTLIGMFGFEGQAVIYCISHVRLVCFDLLILALYQPFVGLYQGVGKEALQ